MGSSQLIEQISYMDGEAAPRRHHHLFSELIYVQDGSALFVIDGKSYPAGPGSLLLANSYELYESFVQERPYRRFSLTLDSSKIEQALSDELLTSVFKNRPPSFTHRVDLSGNSREVNRIFTQMLEEFHKQSDFSDKMLRNLLENLLIYTYRACPDNFASPDQAASGKISEIQRYIEQHFAEDIRVAELAERYFVSPSYLSHAFKSQIGYSPKQYVLLNRLSYAKELLETSDFQIGQVASESGFSDVNNFIRSFREWYGLSPGSYRNQSFSQDVRPGN